VSAVDWTFEERLHERIDARRLIATRLSPRQRRVLCRSYLHGETLREIAAPDGVSPVRVAQILATATRRLQVASRALPAGRVAPPSPAPPPGFDRVAFLCHMQGLIARREIKARQDFEAERAVLDGLLEGEQAYAKAKAQPKLSFAELKASAVYGKIAAELEATAKKLWPDLPKPPLPTQTVEPWFDLARQPTHEDLRCIAQYTLGYFAAACGPMQDGSPDVGSQMMRVLCPRDADAIAEAMQRVKASIPSSHRLSACLLDTPPELLCVALGNRRVALRVSSIEDGKRVAIEVTHSPAELPAE